MSSFDQDKKGYTWLICITMYTLFLYIPLFNHTNLCYTSHRHRD